MFFKNRFLTISLSSLILIGALGCSQTTTVAIPLEELKQKFNCQEILPVSKELTALSPSVSMQECRLVTRNDPTPGIVRLGCRLPLYKQYLVNKNGEIVALKNAGEFQDFFGEVDSEKEALAFAIALTNSQPEYNLKIPPNYRIYVKNIPSTEVTKTPTAYQVRLFNQQKCGCGTHPYFAINYQVTKAGEVKEISRQKIYENPEMDNLCVD